VGRLLYRVCAPIPESAVKLDNGDSVGYILWEIVMYNRI
jgi:hypothetical protein